MHRTVELADCFSFTFLTLAFTLPLCHMYPPTHQILASPPVTQPLFSQTISPTTSPATFASISEIMATHRDLTRGGRPDLLNTQFAPFTLPPPLVLQGNQPRNVLQLDLCKSHYLSFHAWLDSTDGLTTRSKTKILLTTIFFHTKPENYAKALQKMPSCRVDDAKDAIMLS